MTLTDRINLAIETVACQIEDSDELYPEDEPYLEGLRSAIGIVARVGGEA